MTRPIRPTVREHCLKCRKIQPCYFSTLGVAVMFACAVCFTLKIFLAREMVA